MNIEIRGYNTIKSKNQSYIVRESIQIGKLVEIFNYC